MMMALFFFDSFKSKRGLCTTGTRIFWFVCPFSTVRISFHVFSCCIQKGMSTHTRAGSPFSFLFTFWLRNLHVYVLPSDDGREGDEGGKKKKKEKEENYNEDEAAQ